MNKKNNQEITIDYLESVLKDTFEISSSKLYPRCYLFPNGNILKLDAYTSHKNVEGVLIKKNIVSELSTGGGCELLENLGCIRINLDSEGFIGLSEKAPTNIQYEKLKEIIDKYMFEPHIWRYWSGNKIAIITPHSDGFKVVLYDINDYTVSDILNRIKRYYSTGILYEEVCNTKNDKSL